jgi:hypothetical protein
MNGGLESIEMKVVVAYLKVLSQYFQEITKNRHFSRGPRTEPGMPRRSKNRDIRV